MKILQVLLPLYLAAIFATVEGAEYYSNGIFDYYFRQATPTSFESFYFSEPDEIFQDDLEDIRSRSLTIMNMVDKNKSKTKDMVLLILLEVELNLLKDKINKRIEICKNYIEKRKQYIFTCNNANQQQIKLWLNSIERAEEKLQDLEGALLLTRQWKREYCH